MSLSREQKGYLKKLNLRLIEALENYRTAPYDFQHCIDCLREFRHISQQFHKFGGAPFKRLVRKSMKAEMKKNCCFRLWSNKSSISQLDKDLKKAKEVVMDIQVQQMMSDIFKNNLVKDLDYHAIHDEVTYYNPRVFDDSFITKRRNDSHFYSITFRDGSVLTFQSIDDCQELASKKVIFDDKIASFQCNHTWQKGRYVRAFAASPYATARCSFL